MERTYAITLALVAWSTALVFGWANGGGLQEVLLTAWYGLLVFAALGYVVGVIAAQIVDETVRTQLTEKIDENAQAQDRVEKQSAAG